MEPRLMALADGQWLAVTPADAEVPIGVFGRTQEEARVRFEDAVRDRERLRAEAHA